MESRAKSPIHFVRVFPALLFLLLLAGCDTSSVDEPRIVGGVDLDEVFAAPSAAELAAVSADWASRPREAEGVEWVAETPVAIGVQDATLRVVRHRVGGVMHYGAIIEPVGAQPGTLPVLMYLHGGDQGVGADTEVPFITNLLGPIAGQSLIVVPSFRDEELRVGDLEFQSDGPPSPWDYDVDDAMALLSVALQEVPSARPDRVALLGISRGGGVGLIMGVRDPRVDAVFDFMGPTDFFGTFVQDVVEEALLGNPRQLPGLDFMNETYLEPLQAGSVTIAGVRDQLVRRSPVLYADRLPLTQVHHGDADTVVPVSQAESLIEAMDRLGVGSPEFEGTIYPGAGHNPLQLAQGFDAVAARLQQVFN